MSGQAMNAAGKSHHAAYVQKISRQVLLGLDFFHTLGITHCGKSCS